MPLTLDFKNVCSVSTARAKSVDLHPVEPWVLAGLYNGQALVYDYVKGENVKTFDVSSQPVRAAVFVCRMNWVILGGDDAKISVFNLLTLEKLKSFDAHQDYVRSLASHPTLPYLLSSSDDTTICLWNWDLGWSLVATFEGHSDYAMMVRWNPRDSTRFASASLDRSVKVWSVPPDTAVKSIGPDFTLLGHEQGVNAVEYSESGDKPFLLSASDDLTLRVWDYQSRQCLQVLTGFTKPVWHAIFHPFLPLICAGGEDGQLRTWNSSTYRAEESFRILRSGRVWALGTTKSGNELVLGHDEGFTILAVGSERPAASIHGGKLLYLKGPEILSANLRLINESIIVDGERIPISGKEVGSSVLFPQSIAHHPNGRLISICGEGEYSILTAQALRSRSYGPALGLVWSSDGLFAVWNAEGKISVMDDNKEVQSFTPDREIKELFGGVLLGVRDSSGLSFYDWCTARLVSRIDEENAYGVYWRSDEKALAIATTNEIQIMEYDPELLRVAIASNSPELDHGLLNAMTNVQMINEKTTSALWVGCMLVFATKSGRLSFWMHKHIDTIGFMPKPFFVIGYVPETERIYLADRDMNLITYKVPNSFVKLGQIAEGENVDEIISAAKNIPESLHPKLARFFLSKAKAKKPHDESRERFINLTLQYMPDLASKFDICIELQDAARAKEYLTIGVEDGTFRSAKSITTRWKQLGDTALSLGDFDTAREAFENGKDSVSLLLLGTCTADPTVVAKAEVIAEKMQERNSQLCCNLLMGRVDKCCDILIKEEKYPEASLFTRTYVPSRLKEVAGVWRENVKRVNELHSSRLIMPGDDDEPGHWNGLDNAKEVESLLQEYGSALAPDDLDTWKQQYDYDMLDEAASVGVDKLRQFLREQNGELSDLADSISVD